MDEPTGQPSGVAVQGTHAARELDALRVALDQLTRLLDDAVVRLAASFEKVAGAGRDRRIDDGVADAITALQFHDIASQLLAQIATRVDAVDELTTARRAPDGRRGATVGGQSGQQRRASRASQVTQANLLAGTIELF